MLQLNLLPPEEKQNLAIAMRTRASLSIGLVLGAVLAVFIVLLLPTFFLLTLQRSDTVRAVGLERQNQEQGGIAGKIAAIKRINQLSGKVLDQEKNRLKIFPLLEGVIREVPAAVRLEAVLLRSGRRELSIEGFSPTRSDLLEFLKALEKDPRLDGVSSPVSNLVKEADIRFSLTAKLK